MHKGNWYCRPAHTGTGALLAVVTTIVLTTGCASLPSGMISDEIYKTVTPPSIAEIMAEADKALSEGGSLYCADELCTGR